MVSNAASLIASVSWKVPLPSCSTKGGWQVHVRHARFRKPIEVRHHAFGGHLALTAEDATREFQEQL